VVGPPSPRAEIRAAETARAVRVLAPGARTVLDLGALNGTLYDPLAAAGMAVTAVEGRPGNCSKLRLLNRCRGYGDGQVEVIEADVRSWDTWLGNYDVVLCCGLLYHLPMPAALELLDRAAVSALRLLVVDSLFSTGGGKVHWDRASGAIRWKQHVEVGDSPEERLACPDAALGDPVGTRLNGDDAVRRLREAGFAPIFQHCIVWSLLPSAAGKDDSMAARRQLYCVREDGDGG
jgi:SAM-dependent methyltransferase